MNQMKQAGEKRSLNFLAFLCLCVFDASIVQAAPAIGQDSGLPLPRFVSLGASLVNARTGPDRRYPVEWVYHRRNLPVQVVQEYQSWRRIRDVDGGEGWVLGSLLSGERTAFITGETRILYAKPDKSASRLWRVAPGVVAKIVLCEENWCQINVDGKTGWIRRSEFWGTFPNENFD